QHLFDRPGSRATPDSSSVRCREDERRKSRCTRYALMSREAPRGSRTRSPLSPSRGPATCWCASMRPASPPPSSRGRRPGWTGRGTAARDLVTDLGAERFMDLDRERFEDVAEKVDLVVDLVGGEILQRSGAAVKDGGIVVSAVEDPRGRLDAVGRVRGANFVV